VEFGIRIAILAIVMMTSMGLGRSRIGRPACNFELNRTADTGPCCENRSQVTYLHRAFDKGCPIIDGVDPDGHLVRSSLSERGESLSIPGGGSEADSRYWLLRDLCDPGVHLLMLDVGPGIEVEGMGLAAGKLLDVAVSGDGTHVMEKRAKALHGSSILESFCGGLLSGAAESLCRRYRIARCLGFQVIVGKQHRA